MSTDNIPCIYLKDGCIVDSAESGRILSEDPVAYAEDLARNGAESLLIHDLSTEDKEHDKNITTIRKINASIGIPTVATGHLERLEDVKKLLYAGCRAVAFDLEGQGQTELMEEAGKRFGPEKTVDLKKASVSGGIELNHFTCSLTWDDLKKGPDGLVPAVVQDHRTDEVLMVAYMNREAFEKTVETGKMTYFSRSRQSLWIKGETSGHFQYVRSLHADCDRDTLLAKVHQIGAACHTGNRSCFFEEILNTGDGVKNPMRIFEEVYGVITDRREHPKEGSYTNYLFDKGIDKILKKVGEEATEIVIAAKNPDREEVKYEIADFLYHVMVLMAECGLTWEDITTELANR